MTPLQQAAQAALEQWNFDSWVEDALMQTLSKALADEQAQVAKSNIEFLYEELRKATDGGSESMTHDDALKQIAYWRDKDEQAQAVKPASLSWANLALWYEAGANDWSALKGIVTGVLHAQPAPPPAVTGERAELVAGLIRKADAWDFWNPEAKRPNVCRKAADMLEADAQDLALYAGTVESRDRNIETLQAESARLAQQVAAPYDQQAMELCNACGWKAIMPGEPCFVCNMQAKAQQVAVPPGYALAMAVLQSSLYQFLDDVDRAECDALIAAAQGSKP